MNHKNGSQTCNHHKKVVGSHTSLVTTFGNNYLSDPVICFLLVLRVITPYYCWLFPYYSPRLTLGGPAPSCPPPWIQDWSHDGATPLAEVDVNASYTGTVTNVGQQLVEAIWRPQLMTVGYRNILNLMADSLVNKLVSHDFTAQVKNLDCPA